MGVGKMKKLIFHGECIITGSNSIDYIKELEIKRAFIVAGNSMVRIGVVRKIENIIKINGGESSCFSDIGINPDTEVVLKGLEQMRLLKPDTVIAVGGGSPIDAAKAMVLFYEYPELNFENAMTRPLPSKRNELNFIVIPSTSGTGTEVTKASVITFKNENIKIGLKSEAFIPDIAILDSNLTLTMPDNVVAETGMDALTHAVECYINNNLDDFTEVLSKGAIEGLFKYLPSSYKEKDAKSREKVHNYQAIAGCAFTNVGLGMSHGIAHAFGGRYNYCHGLLNAIALPYVLEYNSKDLTVNQKLKHLSKVIGSNDFIESVKKLNQFLNIPRAFADLGLERDVFINDFELLVDNSLKGSTRANPVKVSTKDMERILKCIYDGKSLIDQ
jgi:alcohol dehydrogenase class IV